MMTEQKMVTGGHETGLCVCAEMIRFLTPQRHEDGEEDGGGVVEQVTGTRRPTGGAQLPVTTHSVTQRTHGDVGLRMADLHAGMHTHTRTKH